MQRHRIVELNTQAFAVQCRFMFWWYFLTSDNPDYDTVVTYNTEAEAERSITKHKLSVKRVVKYL
jgi:hypothetical protein